MNIFEAKQKLSRGIVLCEANGTTLIDGDYAIGLLNQIFKEFDKDLKQSWIDGSNANFKALKDSGKLKGE